MAGEPRKCGACSLCCRLVPVNSLAKPAGVRCQHQGGPLSAHGWGCAVYRKPGFPGECGIWACRWLVDDTAGLLDRPDQSHLVIDIVPDFVRALDNNTHREVRVPVVQVWIDPNFPDAHRDPELRRWVVMNEPACAMLVRFNSKDVLLLLPPHMSDTGEWEEIGDNRTMQGEEQHSAEQIAAVLSERGAM